MRHGDTVVHTGFLVSCAALLVSALLSWTGRLGRIVDGALRGVVLVSLCMFFLGRLAMYVAAQTRVGCPARCVEIDSAITNLAQLSLPLIFVAGIVVVDLALDVSTSLEQPARRLSARWALAILLALLTIKLYVAFVPNRQLWVDLVHDQPLAVAWTVGSAVLLVALVAVTTRFPQTERFVDAKEKVIYLGSLVLAGPILLSTVGFGIAIVWFTELDSLRLARLNDRVPYEDISRWYPLVVSVLAVALGAWLMRRSRGGYGDELGSALVVVGGWNVPASISSAFLLRLPIMTTVVDVLVPLAVLAVVLVVVVRRGTLSASTSVLLAVLVVFSWLVTSRGDYISFAGSLLGLSSVVVLAFGIVYSLVSDSAFASESSRSLPRDARPMLFVGYTLGSVALVHWVEVTHEPQNLLPVIAFTRIAIPLAAWMVGRRLLRGPASASGEPGALAEEVGDGVDTTQR